MKQRIFIAFQVSLEMVGELEKIQEALREKNRHVRINWVKPDGFHITVQFIGDTEEKELQIVKNIFRQVVVKYNPIVFESDCISAFPNDMHPKTIIVKCFEHARASNRLQRELTDALVNKGIAVELKKWIPHITIARNKTDQRVKGFEQIVIKPVTWTIHSIEIMASKLLPDGPEYTVLESCNLSSRTA